MTYTIYHIPGKKVGCTNNFEQRKSQYEEGTIFEILDLIPDELGDEVAGDIEWFYADYFGYPKGKHYSKFNWNVTLTLDQRVEGGKAGGTKTNQLGKSGFQTGAGGRRAGELGVSGFQTGAAGRVGGKRTAELGTGAFHTGAAGRRTGELGKSGFQTGTAGKAGGRNSINSPNHITKQYFTCSRCGKTGRGVNMFIHVNKGAKNCPL